MRPFLYGFAHVPVVLEVGNLVSRVMQHNYVCLCPCWRCMPTSVSESEVRKITIVAVKLGIQG